MARLVATKDNSQVEGKISDVVNDNTVILHTLHHVGIVTTNIETMIDFIKRSYFTAESSFAY